MSKVRKTLFIGMAVSIAVLIVSSLIGMPRILINIASWTLGFTLILIIPVARINERLKKYHLESFSQLVKFEIKRALKFSSKELSSFKEFLGSGLRESISCKLGAEASSLSFRESIKLVLLAVASLYIVALSILVIVVSQDFDTSFGVLRVILGYNALLISSSVSLAILISVLIVWVSVKNRFLVFEPDWKGALSFFVGVLGVSAAFGLVMVALTGAIAMTPSPPVEPLILTPRMLLEIPAVMTIFGFIGGLFYSLFRLFTSCPSPLLRAFFPALLIGVSSYITLVVWNINPRSYVEKVGTANLPRNGNTVIDVCSFGPSEFDTLSDVGRLIAVRDCEGLAYFLDGNSIVVFILIFVIVIAIFIFVKAFLDGSGREAGFI